MRLILQQQDYLHIYLQIAATEEDKTPPSEVPRMQRSDGIHLALANCISTALENLALTEEERKVTYYCVEIA